jgi:MFS family permease
MALVSDPFASKIYYLSLFSLVVIALFEIGSLFCGVAPNMPFLIFGRAVAGVGAAGIFISILTIIARVTRLEDRPLLFGAFGAVFAVSSVAGVSPAQLQNIYSVDL